MLKDVAVFATSTLVSTISATIPVVIGVYLVMRKLMKDFIEGKERSHYDDAKREAILSEIRSSYENRIADLNREMVATRVRWEDANHLVIAGQRSQPVAPASFGVDVSSFLKPYGIDAESVDVDPDKVFVLTPFSKDEKDTYNVIKSVCSNAGFVVVRGDERRADGDILSQIVNGIVTSSIVIANISTRNPNVFFELGIAMALGKPTLLISDTLSDVPFDLQSRRIIIFTSMNDLARKLTNALLKTVRQSNF